MKKRVLSGIQPSGTLHIGNYHGAIRNWVAMLDEFDCYFCIVDYHVMTLSYDPSLMQKRIFDAACVNMACGLDPERCVLFVQSRVLEHTELAWIFNCLTPIGEAMRMTQFKEKSEQHKQNINLGLLTYPVLQAADILLYRPQCVPVGEDQVQHIELARDIARKFNNTFGDFFPEPTAKLTQTTRYPWDGRVEIAVEPETDGEFALRLRIPGWCLGTPAPGGLYSYLDPSPASWSLTVNGEKAEFKLEGQYAVLLRDWRRGDRG
ncbi:MAG: tryptophan--tRNA ligase, partial [Planctomycetes bacterium]|nr:tryptophan--tRNA ligase [Planctomycetota bacterium]